MTHCKYCGCSGWFFSLNASGLCVNCAHIVSLDIAQRKELLREDAGRAEETINPQTRLAKLEQIIVNLQELAKYEEKGIPTLEDPAKDALVRRKEELDCALLETAQQETELTLKKVQRISDARAKIKAYGDLLLRLADYRGHASNPDPFLALERRVHDAVYQIELDLHLARAVDLEQTGKPQEALGLYQEAMAYLKALDMAPDLKIRHIAQLNGKIKSLQPKKEADQ
ncbi:MAG: hypothetical protein WCU88_08575 [Elusimicrobiota bacterium]|jgi:hypothetical protein